MSLLGKTSKSTSTRMGTSEPTTKEALQIPKNFFTTRPSKAFLETHGTNYHNFDSTFFNTTNKSTQAHDETNNENEPPHIDICFPSPDQKTQTCPEWYGTKLAKQQARREQRAFAKRQCVRFGGCDGCRGASSNNYGDDNYGEDEDDDDGHKDENKDGEQGTVPKEPWQFSKLAKSFAAKEQKLFKTMAKRCKRIEEEVEEGEEQSPLARYG